MASVTRDDIAAALSAIMDEDSGKDVVSAGLIQGLVVREGHVGFSVEVDPKKLLTDGVKRELLRQLCTALQLGLAFRPTAKQAHASRSPRLR